LGQTPCRHRGARHLEGDAHTRAEIQRGSCDSRAHGEDPALPRWGRQKPGVTDIPLRPQKMPAYPRLLFGLTLSTSPRRDLIHSHSLMHVGIGCSFDKSSRKENVQAGAQGSYL
ncbi:unnamed protein product, partial [Gulo gulo]